MRYGGFIRAFQALTPLLAGIFDSSLRGLQNCRVSPFWKYHSIFVDPAAFCKPRTCREKSAVYRAAGSLTGSPPRMRGKEIVGGDLPPVRGITPACAGKRCPDTESSGCSRDHPRVCGEKSMLERRLNHALGSPPHVRGKVRTPIIPHFRGGITPACAGKSHLWLQAYSHRKDHPRMCGEKGAALPAHSPPGGITPAHAGKSCGHQCREYMPQDHPRVYGEKRFALMAFQLFTGSSPRMRGKERHLTVTGWVVGITPACAGKSIASCTVDSVSMGSPPHVRGKVILCPNSS